MIKKYLTYIKEEIGLYPSNDRFLMGIIVKNEEEYNSLMIKLQKDGYMWSNQYSPVEIRYRNTGGTTRDVIYLCHNKKLSWNSRFDHFNGKYDNVQTFKFEDMGTLKKIENPDDPYNEEDWGYEISL